MYPEDEWGYPERQDGESWYHYHLRWWMLWASETADRKYRGIISHGFADGYTQKSLAKKTQ